MIELQTDRKEPAEPLASPASQSISERIAQFVRRARYEDLPPKVVTKAKEQMVFFLARAFEGAGSAEGQQARRVLIASARSDGVSVIGDRLRLDPCDAAFVNCSLMRGAGGRDDVLWPAGVHAGVITLPTALALAEASRVSGRALILALVLGYEVLGKLARAAETWAARLPRRPTNVYGAFGPITVAGYLLQLDHVRLSNAYGYAANLGIGIPEGGMMDHYYSLINRNGVLATKLAAAGGIAYSPDTIEGSAGLYRSFFAEVPRSLPGLVDALGSDWEILTAEQKRYPGTGQNAVAVDLLLHLMQRQRLTPQNVASIQVVQPHASDSEPRKHEVAFQGPFSRSVQAYSSLPYALAVALMDQRINLQRYPDTDDLQLLNDPAIARLMKKITLRFESGHLSSRYCRIAVRLTDGHVLHSEAEHFAFEFPPTAWGPALREFGARLVPESKLKEAEQMLLKLETLDDVGELMSTLVPNLQEPPS